MCVAAVEIELGKAAEEQAASFDTVSEYIDSVTEAREATFTAFQDRINEAEVKMGAQRRVLCLFIAYCQK